MSCDTDSIAPHIYVIGAQSTGKTTLVNSLQANFERPIAWQGKTVKQPTIITEVARTVLRTHSFTTHDISNSPERAHDLQCLILEAQNDAEAAQGKNWFISDRSGIDPLIYAERYGKKESVKELLSKPACSSILARMKEGLIIVCEAGVPWLSDDGTRLMPKSMVEWTEIHEMFCRRLETLKLNFHVLPKQITALTDRRDFVLSKWEQHSPILREQQLAPSTI